jgi:signal transduction histidine kinase
MDFLAMMSHELRTPLNAIAGYAELLELGLRGPLSEAQLADVRSIHRNERHLLSLIDEVLMFAKIDAGQVSVDPEPIRLQAALESVGDLITPQIERKALRYSIETCDPGIVVFADLEKLQQIMLNLLSNAVKFTGNGGDIIVSGGLDPEHEGFAVVRVRDTGIGIPADQREAIFQPFVQLDHGLTRTIQGTGLGLAISRDLARAMGGDLHVTGDTAEGEGAEFSLVLPLR